jgi:hypothetical protein
MGHASIADTEGAYGHLVREHHERGVDALDPALWSVAPSEDSGGKARVSRPGPPAASQLRLAVR